MFVWLSQEFMSRWIWNWYLNREFFVGAAEQVLEGSRLCLCLQGFQHDLVTQYQAQRHACSLTVT